MDKKELEKEIKRQKERTKKAIDKCERFIVFTDTDTIGCAGVSDLCTMLSLGLRNLMKDVVPKPIMKNIFDLVLADDMYKHMEEKIEELNKEMEKESEE